MYFHALAVVSYMLQYTLLFLFNRPTKRLKNLELYSTHTLVEKNYAEKPRQAEAINFPLRIPDVFEQQLSFPIRPRTCTCERLQYEANSCELQLSVRARWLHTKVSQVCHVLITHTKCALRCPTHASVRATTAGAFASRGCGEACIHTTDQIRLFRGGRRVT